jgi:hypothetical protein
MASLSREAETKPGGFRRLRSSLPRFGLRKLFVFGLLFCLLFWLGRNFYRKTEEQAALEALTRVDAKLTLFDSDGGHHGSARAFPVDRSAVAEFFGWNDELRVRSVFLWTDGRSYPADVPRAMAYLPTFQELEWVSLSGPEINDGSMFELRRLPNLRKVWLDRTQVTSSGLARLGPPLNLEEVRVFGGKDWGRGLSKLTTLRRLVIEDAALTSAEVEAIASLPHLEELTLEGVTPVDPNTYAPLGRAVGLTSLRLSDGYYHDADLKVLAKLEKLEALSVAGMRDAALANLAPLKRLRRVEFDFYVSEQAAMRFSEERPECMVRHNGHVGGRYYRAGRIVDESELTPTEANVWKPPAHF